MNIAKTAISLHKMDSFLTTAQPMMLQCLRSTTMKTNSCHACHKYCTLWDADRPGHIRECSSSLLIHYRKQPVNNKTFRIYYSNRFKHTHNWFSAIKVSILIYCRGLSNFHTMFIVAIVVILSDKQLLTLQLLQSEILSSALRMCTHPDTFRHHL